MRFGKLKMYFILQGIMLLILSVHLGRWHFSETTEGVVRSPYSATVLTAHYKVDGIAYTNTYMRNGYPFTPKTVIIRHLTHKPSVSRINNTYGDRNLICTCEPLENYLEES